MPFEDAVKDFPAEFMNVRPPNVSYTPWHLLEHVRITQWDILDYIRNPNYVYIEWPRDYWPAEGEVADQARWNATLDAFYADLAALKRIVSDRSMDLYAPLHGRADHTILREILVVADHNAYHVGEFAILRQVMGSWPANRG
jgi:hypothetical protein